MLGVNPSMTTVRSGSGNTLTLNNSAATLTLTGSNTYSGATTITAGDLALNGSIASGSSVAIGSAGTLSGSPAVPSAS